MPIVYTRLGQATGELKYEREWLSRYPARVAEVETGFAHTGNACVKITGVPGSCFGWGFTPGTHTRGAFYYRMNVIPGAGEMPIFYITDANSVDNFSHKIWCDFSTQEIVLDLDEAEYGRVGMVSYDFPMAAQWFHMSWDFNPAAWFAFYINNVQVFNVTGPFVFENPSGFWIGSTYHIAVAETHAFYVDDVYIDTVTGATGVVVPPRRIFLPMTISAAGSYSEWTPTGAETNADAVDDAAVPDGLTAHNHAALTSKRDTFEMTDIVTPTAPEPDKWRFNTMINLAVAERFNVAQDALLQMIQYDGMNTALGTAGADIGPDFLTYWWRFPLQPDGSAWTEQDANDMEYGYRSSGAFT